MTFVSSWKCLDSSCWRMLAGKERQQVLQGHSTAIFSTNLSYLLFPVHLVCRPGLPVPLQVEGRTRLLSGVAGSATRAILVRDGLSKHLGTGSGLRRSCLSEPKAWRSDPKPPGLSDRKRCCETPWTKRRSWLQGHLGTRGAHERAREDLHQHPLLVAMSWKTRERRRSSARTSTPKASRRSWR